MILNFLGSIGFIKVGVGVYQHLPEKISPEAFHIGFLQIGWYSLMYVLAFLTVYLLLLFRIRKKEANYSLELVEEFLFYSFWGLVIGARLGYILFYNLPYYLANPWAIISPLDSAGKFIGIYGMSYHGGLIGVIIATWLFTRKHKIEFLKWADFAVPAIPAGFFFGRIGNFLNGELYGRITTKPWGMYFPASPFFLRHPSQLYEAFFEGLILFLILWTLRSRPHPASQGEPTLSQFWERGLGGEGKRGRLLLLYIFLYGLFRFFLEFFREPDPQLGFILKWAGNGLTMGQVLTFGMIILSVFVFLYQKREKRYNE